MLKTSWLVAWMACNLNPTMAKRYSKRKLCGVLRARGRCMQRRLRFKLELDLKCGGGTNIWCSSPGLWANQPVPRGKGGDIRLWYKKMGKHQSFDLGGVEYGSVLHVTAYHEGRRAAEM